MGHKFGLARKKRCLPDPVQVRLGGIFEEGWEGSWRIRLFLELELQFLLNQ